MNIIETLPQLLRQLRDYERGVTTVEHAIMLVLIAIAVAARCSVLQWVNYLNRTRPAQPDWKQVRQMSEARQDYF